MSNEFLHSSPSRQLIDPLIYNNFNDIDEKNKNDETDDEDLVKSKQHKLKRSKDINTPKANSILPPTTSASKQPLTGWTPLISKTFFNDQFISYNSTPSSKFFNGVISNHEDFGSGLNLTPFLNHNLNLPQSNQQNITPFHDKSLHLTDFFMDSPIRATPLKDLDTITPSKFKLTPNDKKTLKQSLFSENNQKRSITQIDTPPRQPHKLSITTKIDDKLTDEEEEDDEEDGDEIQKPILNKKSYRKVPSDTPSKKVLTDVSSNILNTKTPLKLSNKNFETPAKSTHPVSSPSTVIMSSGLRSNDENQKIPPSPTPKKEIKKNIIDFKPTMGVFNERKQPSKKSKKKNNKQQMQAGMNKFQIVFTDVHTKLNNQSKSKKLSHLNASRLKKTPNPSLPPPSKRKDDSDISKESNSSVNSNLNMSSTDHSSFELGNILSTPNKKFVLDKMFDKPSPNLHYNQYNQYNMPPPRIHQPPPPQQHPQQQQQHPQQPVMMMMMMSTPQHQNVLNYPILNHDIPNDYDLNNSHLNNTFSPHD
ncbi:hypothetical protein HYPBUDRAFT_7631 [Hyphopichia burtonii NRRL Y-1933]|uniref:Uncharacterized protein n=1 Tax=Hyphopichia burtonii NRRL Y-1933 TaxID=984485 RepID=A0A1E4RDW1_9ASCO|nr:hypothetical protein HYPBUDRAFT_7631 [Hyphopichia burtonii NRRL Y-1933]ODV65447.1 hypothetical protein HYPBUDRAFT_7631 [Hyphopichia burtonii NRRL Y-1933]